MFDARLVIQSAQNIDQRIIAEHGGIRSQLKLKAPGLERLAKYVRQLRQGVARGVGELQQLSAFRLGLLPGVLQQSDGVTAVHITSHREVRLQFS